MKEEIIALFLFGWVDLPASTSYSCISCTFAFISLTVLKHVFKALKCDFDILLQ